MSLFGVKMDTSHVPLKRTFSLVTRDTASEENFGMFLGFEKQKDWPDLEMEYRVVILADAGAGKTFEMRAKAEYAIEQGRAAFFIRIEDLDINFEDAFEIGTTQQFEQWLESTEDAWFFLDSVDEARLDNPGTFEKAIKLFSQRIKKASHRAHIYISSRPYAWRFQADKQIVERFFPFASSQQKESFEESEGGSVSGEEVADGPLRVYQLRPLDLNAIRQFAEYRSTPNVDKLIADIKRTNLLTIAERPFDLEGLLVKWKDDSKLGSRLESLQHNIELRLNEVNLDRKQQQPLNSAQARQGARLLAAAVTLTGEAGILVPDQTPEKVGIDAEKVLRDWHPNDVKALLERGLFNDIIYGAVRFRHREIRELLTAEWFYSLVDTGNSRCAVESLIFKDQYGEQVVTPRLRPILPWLILFDPPIRKKALALHPEIAVEGGDIARLPLNERKRILVDIVRRIVADEDDRSARDNSAIARIAQPDLSDEVKQLIIKYANNDDAIFFLGRLVWQGNMTACVEDFMPIAIAPERGKYARIASVRASSTTGTVEQKMTLWKALNEVHAELPRELLAELLNDASANLQSVSFLLSSIDKLPPYNRRSPSGLSSALHTFIDRISNNVDLSKESILYELVVGINHFLDREPHLEHNECKVSKEFTWLIGPACHAAERLMFAHAVESLSDAILSILLKAPAIRNWRGENFSEHKHKLHDLVPRWPELNDALFWKNVTESRETNKRSDGRLTNIWQVDWLGHYWQFNADAFERVLAFITSQQFGDDKLIALSLAFRLYEQENEPEEWLERIRQTILDNPILESSLEECLASLKLRKIKREESPYERQYKARRQKEERNRALWIKRLRANPDFIRNPQNLSPGELSNDQGWLLDEIEKGRGIRMNRGREVDWRSLLNEFGEDVAYAFRDAAIAHWRAYQPALRSDGADTSSVSYSLIFAMVGLEFEAQEVDGFPLNLTDAEVEHALRYATYELNGFPSWLDSMYKAHPHHVKAAVIKELYWELENSKVDKPLHYILHDLAYRAPWLHSELVEPISQWISINQINHLDSLRYSLQILTNGGATTEFLADLAKSKVEHCDSEDLLPNWYALWVDMEPETGIQAVESWLEGKDRGVATLAAQLFITALIGGRRDDLGNGTTAGKFRTASNLKSLYLMMHRFIRASDDIERAGKGVYSPELRDNAQEARSQLFNYLVEIPGKETYLALIELARVHPDDSYRQWMKKRAYKRAEEDADLELWLAQQVQDFGAALEMTPATHRQLFDLGVLRLNDFKNWVERGNDSLAETYQKAADETEMRKIIAHWLNEKAHSRYTCAEEANLANNQRPDIWFQHPNIKSPVPIELKLLDKGWSGPKLCERLRNQLAGDYLREETAGCGIFLLVWQGKELSQRWQIEGKTVDLSKLKKALEEYWFGISDQFPNVSSIEIIVIDLTLRAERSAI